MKCFFENWVLLLVDVVIKIFKFLEYVERNYLKWIYLYVLIKFILLSRCCRVILLVLNIIFGNIIFWKIGIERESGF